MGSLLLPVTFSLVPLRLSPLGPRKRHVVESVDDTDRVSSVRRWPYRTTKFLRLAFPNWVLESLLFLISRCHPLISLYRIIYHAFPISLVVVSILVQCGSGHVVAASCNYSRIRGGGGK
jgi:hypothetical protein